MSAELLISHADGQTMAARREDGTTVELRVERARSDLNVGHVVKARVTRVIPGIQSAFVGVGPGRDAFLHATDVIAAEDEGAGRSAREPIERRLREGEVLLVQVIKESAGNKGPRVTCDITLPGRYLAYMPRVCHSGISRRIRDAAERERIERILGRLTDPPGGFIARTAARDAPEPVLRAEAATLTKVWRDIEERAARCAAPTTVHRDLDLLLRSIRDEPAEGLEQVVVDDEESYHRALAYLKDLDPVMAKRVRMHPGPRSLFEATGVDQDIVRALKRRVWLRSGGYILIEPTEALVSIDVNTGKYLGERDLEKTALRTNLEACTEIARQLRLRDLGGIIVVDFIDMSSAEHRAEVMARLKESLRVDRARTKLVGLSELGLAQLTRKRDRIGFEASITRPCPACHGHGRLKSPERVAAEALTEIRRLLPDLDGQTVTVRVHPEVSLALGLRLQSIRPDRSGLGRLRIEVEEDPGLRPDRFDVLAL